MTGGLVVPARLRSALYLPASNARALQKARTLDADMLILDLEDAVKAEDKAEARAAAVAAVAEGFGDRPVAIRVNGPGSPWHDADVAAVRGSPRRSPSCRRSSGPISRPA